MSQGDPTPDDGEGPVDAVTYHGRTKHSPRSVRADDFQLDFPNQPRPYKLYRDRPRVDLPGDGDRAAPTDPALSAIARREADPDGSASATDLATLAGLSYFSNGVTRRIERRGETMLFRAAACTGKLYHVDVYAVVGGVQGEERDLPAGVYHYEPRSDSFDVLREGDFRGVLADASAHDPVRAAPVTFVATSTWWRNAWKYRDRTFRHAFWDSGTVLANLLATAHALSLRAEVVTGFADAPVAELLGIDPTHEAPLELVPVGSGDPAPDAPAVDPVEFATEPLSDHEVEYPLVHRAWRAGTLPDGEAAREWRGRVDSGDRVGTSEPGDGDRIPLDPVDRETASACPLDLTIRRRGSAREYAREAVSFRKFSTVLDRAFRGVPADVTGGDHALSLNDAYLVVNGVADLPSGTYHYHPDAGELEALDRGECRREAGHLALDQRLGTDAAACVYFLTDVEEVTECLGSRGYRAATLEAAITAGRLYLAAYAHRDLGATGLTFYDDEVTEFFAPRSDGQSPTFLLTIGRPDRR